MKTLYLDYDSSATGGEPESDEKWCSYSPTYHTVHFKKLYRSQPEKFFCTSVEVSDDLYDEKYLHLAVVRYQDGNTFGTSHGNWHILGLYGSEEEAAAALEVAKVPAKDGDYGNYRPWEGYFNRWEDGEIHVLSVKP